MPKVDGVWIDISVNTKAMREAVDEIRKGVDQINKSMAAAAKGTEKSMGRMRRAFRRMRNSWKRTVDRFDRWSNQMLESGEETVQVITMSLAAVAGVSIWASNNYESNMARIRAATKGGAKVAKEYETVVRSVYASGVPKSLGETTRAMQLLLNHIGQIPQTKAEKYMRDLAAASWYANAPMDELLLNALDLKNEFNIGLTPALELAANGFDKDRIEAMGLDKALNQVNGTINRSKKELKTDPWVNLRKEWQKWQEMLAPLGERLREFAEEWLPKLRAEVQKVVDWFRGLNKQQQDMVIWIGIAIALIPLLAMLLGSLGFILIFVYRAFMLLLWPLRLVWNLFRWLWGLLLKMRPVWQWLKQQWDKLRMVLQRLMPWLIRLRNVFMTLWRWVMIAWRWFRNLSIVALILRGVMALLTHPIGWVILAIIALVGAVWLLIANWDWLKKKAKEVWNAIWTKIKDAADKILKKWEELKKETVQKWEDIKRKIKSKTDEIKNKAGGWGYNIVKAFADGMLMGISPVIWAASKIAGIVSSYLGHRSPTEKGPGQYSDEWAPNLINMYAEGIEAGIPKVATAVTGVARVVATGMGTTNRTINYNVDVNAGGSTITERGLVRMLQKKEWFYGRS